MNVAPGDSVEMSVNIKIGTDNKSNHVEVFVFRLFSDLCGYFGEPLVATVEVTGQEEELTSSMRAIEKSVMDINPFLYEIANEFAEEGLGTFDLCLQTLIECQNNYDEAKKRLRGNAS